MLFLQWLTCSFSFTSRGHSSFFSSPTERAFFLCCFVPCFCPVQRSVQLCFGVKKTELRFGLCVLRLAFSYSPRFPIFSFIFPVCFLPQSHLVTPSLLHRNSPLFLGKMLSISVLPSFSIFCFCFLVSFSVFTAVFRVQAPKLS